MTPTTEAADLWRDDEERWVERRSAYLRRRFGLRESIARSLAWHEIGYSAAGCAKKIGSTRSTVRDYFDAVADDHDDAALLVKRADELGVDAPLVPEGSK